MDYKKEIEKVISQIENPFILQLLYKYAVAGLKEEKATCYSPE